MKIANSGAQTGQSSSNDTHQFQISANGTAFQILSSGLYSNKHAAVLRELSCNAADAHVAAGIAQTPIEVTLPTSASRDLVIRDFGFGLSHEQVLSLYTTYFSSDKRDSNAFVGGLGLGSKSPFAYTDAFTVTSIHKGVKSIYSCNIAVDGAPTVTRLMQEKTKEPQGIEVRLLTKEQDIHLFHREACNVFQWFDTAPNVNVPLTYARSEQYIMSTPAYDLAKRSYSSQQRIKMGNVTYPLQIQSLDIQRESLWGQLLSTVVLLLKSPIGHLQVAASREALQYDPTTKKNLVQLYQQAYNDLARKLVAAYNDKSHKNAWSRETAVAEWLGLHFAGLQAHERKLIHELVAQSSNDAKTQLAAQAVLKMSPSLPTFAGNDAHCGVYWYDHEAIGRKTVQYGTVRVGKNSMAAHLRLRSDSAIVVADDKNITEKMDHWRQKQHRLPSMLLVSPLSKNDVVKSQEHAQKIADALGGIPVLMLSKMPLPGLVIAPAIKRDYVEIDDRMVDVLDFQTAAVSTMRFGDVPAQMRYVLVRDTDPKSNQPQYLKDGPKSAANLLKYTLDKWFEFFKYARAQNIAWDGPTGTLVLRPVDVARLKVEQAGVPWLQPSLSSALQSPSNKTLIDFGAALWPTDQKLEGWQRQKTTRASGWIGDFGMLLANANTKQATALSELLDEAGLLQTVRARANATNPIEGTAWTGYSEMLTHVLKEYPETAKVVTKPLSNAEQCAKMNTAYPLLAHIDTKVLHEAIGSNAAAWAQALKLLRVCLHLS